MNVMKNLKGSLKSEAQEQSDLIRWANECIEKNIHPELMMLYAIPNGGTRDKIEAVNLKHQGVVSGVPDLCLAVPRGPYHGLYIELKYGNNKPTDKQKMWLNKLNENDYAVAVCYGWQQAAEYIEKYLLLKF